MNQNEHIPFDKEIDAVGLNCPLPILHTKKTLSAMQPGQVLKIRATDLGAAHDIPAYCRQSGNQLVTMQEEAELMIFYVRRQ